ncbi:MAG: hypothetical protein IPM80_18370 [Proteobacteria bacterium]|nr:hypothetical protein [Pseudomonadota bacterium]
MQFHAPFARKPRRWSAILALVGLTLCATPHVLQAHSDAYFDGRASAHGGRMRMAGPLHLELVIHDGRVLVYVTNHLDEPQTSAGGEAAVRFPAQDVRVTLAADGDNRFSAAAPAALAADSEAVVFVKLPGLDAQSAQFKTPTAARDAGGGDAHAGHH